MKDTQELRAFLVEQLSAVATKKIDSDRAKGIANISQQIYNSLNMELKMANARAKLGGKEIEPVKFSD